MGFNSHFVVFDVFPVWQRELAGVAAAVLWVYGVHQTQRAVPKRDSVGVQLHVAVPNRRGDAVHQLAVVAQEASDLLAVGEGPVERGIVQVRRSFAGDGQVFPLNSSYLCQKQNG